MKGFHFFWLSEIYLKCEIKIINTHMGEKWVDAVMTKTNINLLSSYHVDDRHNYDPHTQKLPGSVNVHSG